jgi:hypothetical protein
LDDNAGIDSYAMPAGENPFPDIAFKDFSQFIGQHFISKISLFTVLVILFSLTENPELLNLQDSSMFTVKERIKLCY